jgi:hypothetical protein
VDLSAYRIIQEALTNVVRHAGTGASCVVGVCYTDAELVIRVTDDGGLPVVLPSVSVAATGTGHGIIGMRERVHLCGGTFGAGSLPNGGFQVTAALPLPAADFRAEGGFRADGAMAAAVDSLSNGSRPDGSRPDGSLAAAGSITLDVAGSITPRTGNGTPAMTGVVTGDGDGRR